MLGLAALACSGKSQHQGGAGSGGTGGELAGSGGSTTTGTGGAQTGSSGGSTTTGTGGAQTGSGGSTGGSTEATPTDLQQYYRAYYEAWCDFEDRCANVNGRRSLNRDYCLDEAEVWVRFETPVEIPYVVDLAHAADCIASEFPADSCDQPSPNTEPPACRRALSRADTVGEGSVCFSGGGTDYVPCDYGLECMSSDGCGYCVPAPVRQPNGSPCTDRDECESENCGVEQTCVPRSGRGEPCSPTVSCRGNLICHDGPDGSTCQDRLGEGDSCADNPFSCLVGLTCSEDSGVCIPQLGLGASCDRTLELSCAAICNFETPDAPTGTCTPTYSWVGEPCGYSSGNAVCLDGVVEETLDPDGTPVACNCAPRPNLAVGSPCNSAADCESSVCEDADTSDPSASGTCREKYHTGEACRYHATCESGYCADSGLCEDAPLCN